jgi:hypothetical protein
VLLDPDAPVQRLLQASLDIVETLRDLAASQVDGVADVAGPLVEVFLGRRAGAG